MRTDILPALSPGLYGKDAMKKKPHFCMVILLWLFGENV